MRALILALLFFVTPAFALTDLEKVEMLRIVDAGVKLAKAEEQIGLAIPALTGKKTELISALTRVFNAQFATRASLSYGLESGRDVNGTRVEQVQTMLNQANSAAFEIGKAIPILQALPSNANITAAIAQLEAITISQIAVLPYTDPHPASYPRVVGPHGDSDISEARIEHATQYIQHTMWDAINFWKNTSLSTTEEVKDFFRNNAEAQEFMFRAWGMDGELILPDDRAIIEADTAAGSGLRPFDFFRLLLEVEYVFSVWPADNFAGRPVKIGAPVSIRAYVDAFTRMIQLVAVRNPNELVAQFTGRRGNIGNGGTTGWASEFYFDMADFWRSMDGIGAGWMVFFHEIPAPPR